MNGTETMGVNVVTHSYTVNAHIARTPVRGGG